jgi:hypothetical protein
MNVRRENIEKRKKEKKIKNRSSKAQKSYIGVRIKIFREFEDKNLYSLLDDMSSMCVYSVS